MNIQNPEKFIKENQVDKLGLEKAKEIYDKLVDDLNYHNYLYYVKSQPIISDYEYDLLFDYLKNLEKKYPSLIRKDSPTQRLTNQIQDELKKAKHKYPLLSLENTYNPEEVEEKIDKIIKEVEKYNTITEDWNKITDNSQALLGTAEGSEFLWLEKDNLWLSNKNVVISAGDSESSELKNKNMKIPGQARNDNQTNNQNPQISFYIEPKYDGLSIELIYKDGYFQQAITRWDGFVWEDVTENAKTINSLPLKINYKGELHIRWEVVVRKSVFEKINKEREKKWLETYSNPRNLASWSLRQLDPSITAERKLDVICYEILNIEEVGEVWDNNIITEDWNKITDNSQPSAGTAEGSEFLWLEKDNLWLSNKKLKKSISTHHEALDFLEEQGFFVYDFKKILWKSNNTLSWLIDEKFLPMFNPRRWLTKEEVLEVVRSEEIKNLLDKEDIEFDGLVIKLDNVDLWDKIWYTEHHPKWAFAFKYPAKQVSTQILDVQLSVWRTWVITPVAILEPVNIDWVIVQKASLHNFDFIKEKDIHIFDYVWVQRSGEVIPYVVSVIKERRKNLTNLTDLTDLEDLAKYDKNYENSYLEYLLKHRKLLTSDLIEKWLIKIIEPPYCPVCDGETFHPDWEVALRCINVACPAQIKEKITYFVSKNWLDIEGLSEKTIETLLKVWLIKDYADIFTLPEKRQELLALPGFKEKKVENIIKAIEEKKEVSLDIFLQALGIEFVWKKTAKLIYLALQDSGKISDFVKWKYIDFEKLMNFFLSSDWEEFLQSINGIWPKVIASIKKFFHEKHNQKVIKKLLNYIKIKVNLNKSGKFTWKEFVITWSIPWLSRDEIGKWIEENWWNFSNQVTKNTSLVLVGEKPWNSKLKKAQQYWISTYSLEKFLKENNFSFPNKLITQESLF